MIGSTRVHLRLVWLMHKPSVNIFLKLNNFQTYLEQNTTWLICSPTIRSMHPQIIVDWENHQNVEYVLESIALLEHSH